MGVASGNANDVRLFSRHRELDRCPEGRFGHTEDSACQTFPFAILGNEIIILSKSILRPQRSCPTQATLSCNR